MQIQEALALIEEYVEALESGDWQDAYDKAAKSLFSWLREYGLSDREIGLACRIIQDYTGYHPSQIRSLGEAEIVKQALYGTLNSEALGRRRKPHHLRTRARWALDNIRFGFGGGNDPIDDKRNRN